MLPAAECQALGSAALPISQGPPPMRYTRHTIALAVALATAAASAYRNSAAVAWLVTLWLPLSYSLSAAVSGRRRLIDQLSGSPLFLGVARVVPYENPLGWRRQFRFDEALVGRWAHAKKGVTSYIALSSGEPYVSDQLFDQQLSFLSGAHQSLLEVSEQVRNLN